MTTLCKRFLFVVRRGPLTGALAREALDQILCVAAFDQLVRVLFVDDGVFQLVEPSSDELTMRHASIPMLRVLDFYDVREVLVESESLHARGLGAQDLAISASVIPASTVKELWVQHDLVVVC